MEKQTIQEFWENLTPKQRENNKYLKHLPKNILSKPWNELEQYVKNHLAIRIIHI